MVAEYAEVIGSKSHSPWCIQPRSMLIDFHQLATRRERGQEAVSGARNIIVLLRILFCERDEQCPADVLNVERRKPPQFMVDSRKIVPIEIAVAIEASLHGMEAGIEDIYSAVMEVGGV